MKCNIDSRGRIWRLLVGFLFFFTGTFLFVVSKPAGTPEWRAVQGALALLGFFMMFEGTMGWCALRALVARDKQ